MSSADVAARVVPWFERRLCAFDLETTAADPLEARVVTACVAHVGGGEPTKTRSWLVDPGIEIPAEAAAIHGVTTERARAEGMPTEIAVSQIAGELRSAWLFGEPVVIMNASYDLTVITREMARHALSPLRIGYVVDPFVLDKQVDKYRKGKRTLTALCDVYRCRIDGAHDSAHDALAAARVAYRIAQLFPVIGRIELEELHRLEIIWFAEQAAGLEAHFRKTDPNARCSREWPVRTAS